VSDDRTPVLIGVGQLVQRDADPREALNPFEMIDRVAAAAAEDAGAGSALLERLDTLALVNLGLRQMQNAPRIAAERLGATPQHEFVSEMGGQVGVTLANLIAERITRGETGLALIAGSNNMRTMARARQQSVELDWPTGGEGTPEMVGVFEPGNSKVEARYGLARPTDIYPIFENALRAARGLDLETHSKRLGELFSRFTRVASENPYAWFPVYRSPEELVTVTPENRMIAFPYPKYLNAVLSTDQAAAFIMASVETARSLGVPEDRFVYWWGGAHTQEQAWWPSERPNFAQCPAMLDASGSALENAGVSTDELDAIDFYSCFPIAVELAAAQLGLAEDDPRGLTVTGGLPYGGGPASAYCLHSIASMAERLREGPGSKGLVTGNGWYLTKHAASVWSTERKPEGLPRNGLVDPLPGDQMERTPAPAVEEANGPGTIETYTVVFDREGAPERGIVLGRLQDGRRFLANTPDDRSLLEAFVTAEEVGREGKLSHSDGLNRFDPL
jgi:acetyl-CoA C-acetyltransferase